MPAGQSQCSLEGHGVGHRGGLKLCQGRRDSEEGMNLGGVGLSSVLGVTGSSELRASGWIDSSIQEGRSHGPEHF